MQTHNLLMASAAPGACSAPLKETSIPALQKKKSKAQIQKS